MGRLSGKVALITGGARGMGESHTRRFIAEGAKVVFTDVLEAEGAVLQGDLGPNALFLRHDVTDQAQWEAVVARAEETFGPVSILVNNAGIVISSPIDTLSVADYRRVVDINQVGVFIGIKVTVPSMRRAGGGSIINISSINGIVGSRGTMAYTASKFAVRGMTKSAAAELGEFNIRVNSVHPGGIKTPMLSGPAGEKMETMVRSLPIARVGLPEEVTNLVLYLASDESSYSTGSEFVVDGGWTAL